jgi:putative phage-type endonuclease
MTIESPFSKPDSFHQRRAKGIGGSEIASILGISPYRSAYSLWLEKSGRERPADISNLPHVVRGILGEEVARGILERDRLKRYIPKTWRHPVKEHWLCSDDGYQLDDNEILEIKCMGKDKHATCGDATLPPRDRVPEFYWCQCQWNLFVSGAVRCWFISFRPEDESMHIVEVLPEPEEQARIAAAVDAFWFGNVKADVPPERTEKDAVTVSVPELDTLFDSYEAALEAGTTVDALVEAIRPYVDAHKYIRTDKNFKARIMRGGVLKIILPGPIRF